MQGDEGEGGGGGGNLGGNYADSSRRRVKNQNVQVNGNQIAINTAGDMKMEGAVVRGSDVTTVIGGNLIVTSRADTRDASSTSASGYIGGGMPGFSGTPGDTLGQQGQLLKSGINGQYGNSNSSSTRVAQQSAIEGSNSTAVIVKGDTTLTGAKIGGGDDGTSQGVLSTKSLTLNAVDQSSSQSGINVSGGFTRDNATTPGVTHADKPSTSSKIEATVNVAQMSGVLTQPTVQTAILISKDLQAAAKQYGGSDKVPVSALRSALAAAGVNVPADASDAQVTNMVKDRIATGQKTVALQFAQAEIQPSVTQSVLSAIGLP